MNTIAPAIHPKYTTAAFLKWAIRFAQADLATLSPGGWYRLREDFETFLGRRGVLPLLGSPRGMFALAPEKPPTAEDFSSDDFAALQQQVHTIVAHQASGRGIAGRFSGVLLFTPQFTGVQGGTTHECFLYLLVTLLNQEPLNRILACPECDTLFYRVRQQAYCSRTCLNRITQRRYRKSHALPS